jgi:hypothetical protein
VKYVFLIWILLSVVLKGTAQENPLQGKISLPEHISNRREVLNLAEKQLSIIFTYSSYIEPDKEVNLTKKEWVLRDLLDTIFQKGKIEYIVRGNNIILKPVISSVESKREYQDIYTVKGYVLDKKENPISYADIYLENKSLGTVTNDEGFFEFNIPGYMMSDTLIISTLGYKKKKIPLQNKEQNEITVHLSREYIVIKGVIVRPENPLEIIRHVKDSINKNYDETPSLMTGFFRESTKQDDNYVALSEALVSIYKAPYKSYKSDIVKLEKARKGMNVEKTELVNYVVQGSLFNNLQLDIVKYGVSFMDPDFFDFYDYELKDKIFINDKPVYVIAFDQKEGVKYPCYKGDVYIDMESLAVIKSTFSISPKGLKYANRLYIKKNSTDFKVKIQYASYEVNYRYYDSCWNLTSTKGEFSTKLRERKKMMSRGLKADFTTNTELIITEKSKENVERIRRNEAFTINDVLVDQIADTDSDYWGNNNVIIPEEPLLETINKFRKLQNDKSKQNAVTKKSND